jgi:hypothetical protein
MKYHDKFMSCNESDGLRTWCKICEKCAFVFLVFSPWLEPVEVCRIFDGYDMFESTSMIPIFLSLVRGRDLPGGGKPYECVGTVSECCAAAELALYKRVKNKVPDIINDEVLSTFISVSSLGSLVPVVLQEICREKSIDLSADLLKLREDERTEIIMKKWLPDEQH